jgi:hypothetical protein
MKKLFLITTLLMLALPVFADGSSGSTICNDRTESDAVSELQQSAIDAGKCLNAEGEQVECPDGLQPGQVVPN